MLPFKKHIQIFPSTTHLQCQNRVNETINCVLQNLRIIQQTMPPFESGNVQSDWDVDFLQDVLFDSDEWDEWDDFNLSSEDI